MNRAWIPILVGSLILPTLVAGVAGASGAVSLPDTALIPVTFEVEAPPGTAADAALFLAGNFQGWRPGDPAYRLRNVAPRTYAITLAFPPDSPLQFKFTLGDWSRVEKGPRGEEIENRLWVVTRPDTLHLRVETWAPGGGADKGGDTLTGNVTTTTVPGFLNGRRVWVYLPPGYEDHPRQRYPVLYMMDGQNVFNAATSFAGEWRVDESLSDLIGTGEVEPLIVVAVDNGGSERLREYTPWPNAAGAGGGGQDHLQAWIDTLLPWVNACYRTRTGPGNTGLAGSSLGGLMALYGAYAHPEVFGRIGAFSPSLSWAGGRLLPWIADRPRPTSVLYVDMGTREEGNLRVRDHDGVDDHVAALRRLGALLVEQGFAGGIDLLMVEGQGDRHNEKAWAARFPRAATFLFPQP